MDTLRHVLQSLAEAEVTVVDVGLRRPTLDDVFLTLTGHAAEEVEEPSEGDADEAERPAGEVREKEGVR